MSDGHAPRVARNATRLTAHERGRRLEDELHRLSLHCVGRNAEARRERSGIGERDVAGIGVHVFPAPPLHRHRVPVWVGGDALDAHPLARARRCCAIVAASVWIATAAGPLLDAKGHVTGALSSFRDVTAERKAQEWW